MFPALALALGMLAPPRHIHLVVNPYGGGGEASRIRDSVLPMFRAAGIEVTTLETDYSGHARTYAASEPLLDAFIGVGGDGTAHEIANGMLERPEEERVPIGMIPAGSGNTWAFDLGLDEVETAVDVIIRGETANVDVIAVASTDCMTHTTEYAINICGYGMPAAVLEQANALRWLGSAQYELAGLTLIASGRTGFSANLEVTLESGQTLSRMLKDASFAQAHINAHMGKRVPFAPDAKMDDGLLDLVIVSSCGGLDILHANAAARGGTHVDLPFVEVLRCRSFTLTPTGSQNGAAEPLEQLNLDGELACSTPFQASCVPQALEVYASTLREEPNDTSSELEPSLVMALVRLVGLIEGATSTTSAYAAAAAARISGGSTAQ